MISSAVLLPHPSPLLAPTTCGSFRACDVKVDVKVDGDVDVVVAVRDPAP
ncbi:MAG TPA: hypothetical protein VHX38_24005 [Pseudonocardiaceae bacterium]|nr:hypothetical protein [Pseudonocardiaceae bacterium]